jgi:hypothetical protein
MRRDEVADKERMDMITCSAMDTTFEPVTSSTSIPFSAAAFRSMWSEPTPAVTQTLRFLA